MNISRDSLAGGSKETVNILCRQYVGWKTRIHCIKKDRSPISWNIFPESWLVVRYWSPSIGRKPGTNLPPNTRFLKKGLGPVDSAPRSFFNTFRPRLKVRVESVGWIQNVPKVSLQNPIQQFKPSGQCVTSAIKKHPATGCFLWRRGRDSNPRTFVGYTLSKRAR